MTSNVDRLAALVAEISTDIWQFDALRQEEKIAVASVLDRADLLLQCGLRSADEAEALLGPDWWGVVTEVRRRRQQP